MPIFIVTLAALAVNFGLVASGQPMTPEQYRERCASRIVGPRIVHLSQDLFLSEVRINLAASPADPTVKAYVSFVLNQQLQVNCVTLNFDAHQNRWYLAYPTMPRKNATTPATLIRMHNETVAEGIRDEILAQYQTIVEGRPLPVDRLVSERSFRETPLDFSVAAPTLNDRPRPKYAYVTITLSDAISLHLASVQNGTRSGRDRVLVMPKNRNPQPLNSANHLADPTQITVDWPPPSPEFFHPKNAFFRERLEKAVFALVN